MLFTCQQRISEGWWTLSLSYYQRVNSCAKTQLRGRQGKLSPRKWRTDPLVNWYDLWAFYEHRTYFFTSHNRHFQMERLLANFWIRLCVCFFKHKRKGSLILPYVTFTAINCRKPMTISILGILLWTQYGTCSLSGTLLCEYETQTTQARLIQTKCGWLNSREYTHNADWLDPTLTPRQHKVYSREQVEDVL